jgi:putative photosynthetic complex assembly protein
MTQQESALHAAEVKPFPKGVLACAAVLIALTIAVAAVARLTGRGVTDVDNKAVAAKVLELRFDDRQDGAITVYDAGRGKMVDVLAPGTSGFVRNVMRSLARERRLDGQGRETPFRMTRWVDGRLTIDDPATGRHVDLGAFGSMNTAAFARLMSEGSTQ